MFMGKSDPIILKQFCFDKRRILDQIIAKLDPIRDGRLIAMALLAVNKEQPALL